MRALQIIMLLLCVLGGARLLLDAPAFFMPARNPAIGVFFDPFASRLLGGGLLALALTGGQYLHAMYYGGRKRLRRNRAAQLGYFALLMLALALLAAAMWRSEVGPNPDYRPPAPVGAAEDGDIRAPR